MFNKYNAIIDIMTDRPINISITTGTVVKIILILGLFAAAFLLKNVLLVVLTAIVIASFVEVVSNKLKKKYKIPRQVVVSVVFSLMLLTIGTLVYFIVPLFLDQVSTLLNQISKALPNVEFLKPFQSKSFILGAQKFVDGIGNDAPITDVISGSRTFITYISTTLFDSVSSIFGGLVNLVILLVISFYLSMQERGVESFLRLVTPLKYEPYVLDLWERTEIKIAGWVQGQLVLGLIVGVLTFVGLSIIGVPYSLLLALIAAVMELVPFGLIFAVIPAVAVALIEGGFSTGFIVLLFYIIIQQLENYLIAPMLTKKTTGVSPLVVIISLLVGAQLAGFWGIILAVPGAVLVLEILEDYEKKKLPNRT